MVIHKEFGNKFLIEAILDRTASDMDSWDEPGSDSDDEDEEESKKFPC